jgi:hypothetical protein
LEFRFLTGLFRKNDPKCLVPKHASQVSFYWPYAHDSFEDDIFTENDQEWSEVMVRMDDPKETNFKAMSLDEQETILEQMAQEVLRARGERITSIPTEVAEAPQGAIETMKVS